MNAETSTTERITEFLSKAEDIVLGFNEITFVPPAALGDAQEGYLDFISSGYELPEGVQCGNFLVIATDDLGDPIFVDLDTETLVVSCAGEDEEGVAIAQLADSLDGFNAILARLAALAEGRDTPELADENPVPEVEATVFLNWFAAENPGSDGWYWELFLENAEEVEED